MDAMVTARVPVEIKKQGDAKLHELGSTATELINAAYQYVIDNDELPGPKPLQRSEEPIRKVLSGEQAREFRKRWNSMKLGVLPDYDGTNFKELLNEARDEYYARFA